MTVTFVIKLLNTFIFFLTVNAVRLVAGHALYSCVRYIYIYMCVCVCVCVFVCLWGCVWCVGMCVCVCVCIGLALAARRLYVLNVKCIESKANEEC